MMTVDNTIEPIDTGSKQDVRPSAQEAFVQEDQIHQEYEISSVHYFSWLSDVFISIGIVIVWAIIPTHNILEEPSYW